MSKLGEDRRLKVNKGPGVKTQQVKPRLVAGLILLALWCVAWKNPLVNESRQGNKFYAEKKYDDALKKYLGAQADHPESEALHLNIGNVLFKQKKYKEASEEYQKAAQSQDKSIQTRACYNLGNCKFRENDFPAAIEQFEKTLDLDPNDQDAEFNLKVARQKLKEMEKSQQGDQNEKNDQDEQDEQDQQDRQGQDKNQDNQDNQDNQNKQGRQQNEQDQRNRQDRQDKKGDRPENQKGEQPSNERKKEEKHDDYARQDPNQEAQGDSNMPFNRGKAQADEKKMSREDALRILQSLDDRENKKHMTRQQEGREYIEYDW